MAVSPNGQQLALSASYGMQVYNLADGALVYAFENKIPRFQGVYSQIEWSPNGNYLAIGTLNFGVRIWDTTSWAVLTQMGDEKAYTSAVWSHPGFAWSPDSKNLVLGIITTGRTLEEVVPGRILIWDQMSNNWTALKTNLDDSILTWHENGQIWVLGDGRIYDILTGELIKKIDSVYDFVVLSPDQKHWYGHIDLGGDVFDLETQKYEFNVCCYAEFAWSPDGRYFASTEEGGNKIAYWDTFEQKTIVFDELGDNAHTHIYALAWTPSGELLAAVFQDGVNYVWDIDSQKVLLKIE